MPPPRNIWSATLDEDFDTINNLLEDGVCVDERSDIGETPLHIAARHGLELTIKTLLNAGANVNLRDWESGWTPLHRSLYFGHVRVSLLLIQAGALIDGGRDQLASVPSGGNRKVRSRSRSESVESASAKGSVRSSVSGRWSHCLSDHDGNTPLDVLSLDLRSQLSQARKESRGGDVYSFGKADFLGYDSFGKADVVTPRRVEALANLHVARLAASRYHSAAVTLDGKLFTWGHGRGGRLGHGNEDICMLPTLVEGLANKRVVEVGASETHTAALTDDGELFTWGRDRFGQLGHGPGGNGRLTPKRVEGMRKTVVVAVAMGTEHTAVVTEVGTCYTWGRNNHGQLGYDSPSQTSTPRPVPQLARGFSRSGGGTGRHVVKVSTSARSTVVVTRGLDRGPGLPIVNEVYQWGHGGHMPSRVNFNILNDGGSSSRWQTHDSRVNIVEVAAAKHHNVALSAVGQVFSWGFGADNLGLDPRETRTCGPKLVAAMLPENCGGNAVYVAASDQHSCVVTDTGDLFTWGTAGEGSGALGHGDRNWQPVAKRVPNLKKVGLVAAAPEHTLVLLQPSCPPLPHGAPFVTPSSDGDGVEQQIGDMRMERFVTVGTDASSEDGEEEKGNGEAEEEDGTSPWYHEARLDADDSDAGGLRSEVLSLKQHCEIVLARAVDLRNASSMLAYADALDAPALTKYCADFVNDNLDGILVLGRESDRECLLETSGKLARSLLGAGERKERRAPSVGEYNSQEAGVGGLFDEEEGLDREAMATALARAELRADTPAANVTARAVRSLKKKLTRISELERMRDRGEGLTADQVRKVQDKSRMQAELNALGSQLERAKLMQKARAQRSLEVTGKGATAREHKEEREMSSVRRALVFDGGDRDERGFDPSAKPSVKFDDTSGLELDLTQGQVEATKKQRMKCEACGVTCTDVSVYADHLRGKRHRSQMAKLEKQLHDVAHTSQPQPRQPDPAAQKAASPQIPSAIPDPRARPDAGHHDDRAKGGASSDQSLRDREPSRNTKYVAVVNGGGGMRVSLEQQHAATQMTPWNGWNDQSQTPQSLVPSVPEPSPVAMSTLRPRKSLSSNHVTQRSSQQGESGPVLHSLTDFIVAPGSGKLARRKSASKRESPVGSTRAWATEDNPHAEEADAAQGSKLEAAANGNARGGMRSRKSFSEIIAEEEREKKEREEYGSSVWFVSRKPRSTSFETIVQQQRQEEQRAEMEKARKMEDEMDEEILRAVLEMSKKDAGPTRQNARQDRGGSGRGGRQRSSAGGGGNGNHQGRRRREVGAEPAGGVKSTGETLHKERARRGQGEKKAADVKSGSGVRGDQGGASRKGSRAAGGNGRGRHPRRYPNNSRCGASLDHQGGKGVEEVNVPAPAL